MSRTLTAAARRHLTPALVVALVALAVSLGGTAWAAAHLTGADIKNGSVSSKDLKDNDVRGRDIRTGNVASSDIATGGVQSADVKDGSLVLSDLSPAAQHALLPDIVTWVNVCGGGTGCAMADTYSQLADVHVTLPSGGALTLEANTEFASDDGIRCQWLVDGSSDAGEDWMAVTPGVAVHEKVMFTGASGVLAAGTHEVIFQCERNAAGVGADKVYMVDFRVSRWSGAAVQTDLI